MIDPFFVVHGGAGVTELLLIRHAQVPEASTAENHALTDLGREQAEVLASYIAPAGIEAIYASPSLRTRETAAALARLKGFDVTAVDDLRDVDNHVPPGLSFREALVQTYGEAEAEQRYRRLLDGLSFDAFGSLMESSQALRSRVVAAIDGIIAANLGGCVAIFSHGPPIAAYVSHVLGSPADFVFYPRLTSITMVLAREDRRQIQLLNAVPHFGVL
jgi:broad specificity phosphatase PhoE